MIYNLSSSTRTQIYGIIINLRIRSNSSCNHEDTFPIILTDIIAYNTTGRIRRVYKQHKSSLVIVAIIVLYDTINSIHVNVKSGSVIISLQRFRMISLIILNNTVLSTSTPNSCRAIKLTVLPIRAASIGYIMFD